MIEWQNLGCVPYREALALQEGLREKRIARKIGNRLLILEHPPVFTLGKRECSGDFLSTEAEIESDGIEIVKTNRGGRITYHGPGQLIGYFIFSLDSLEMGVKDFVYSIEEICIGVLKSFGIRALRDRAHPGLWIGENKIAAIGLNVSHGVTEHGFSLNVSCDLKPYRHILACGIRDRGITSMEMELKRPVSMADVKESLISSTSRVFERNVGTSKN